MSNIFGRMFRVVRRTARQAWGTVTRTISGLTTPVMQYFRTQWPWSWKKTLLYLVSLGLLGTAVYLLGPQVLVLLGFAATGVLADSLAARIQSVFFGAYTTYPFSWFQSAGATTGAAAGGMAVAGGVVLAAAALVFYVAWNMS